LALAFSKRISGTTPYYNLIRRVAFPSTRSIIESGVLFTTIGIGLSFLIAQRSVQSFVLGASWGILIFAVPSFISAVVLYFSIMKEDPLFYLRRCLALSLFTTITWVVVFIFSSLVALADPRFLFPDFAVIVGLFAVIPIRALAVFSMSRTSFAKRTLFTFIEPTLTALMVILVFGVSVVRVATGLIVSSIVGLTFAFALIITIETSGRRSIGFSPIRMFRAFLTDWLEGENKELESYLTELGVDTELDVAAFAFRGKAESNIKGVVLVSNFHPGPFLNIGSSVLPFLFQSVMKKRLNAIGFVPHGVSGHELNLVSQQQNARVVNWVLSNLEQTTYHSESTPVIRSKNEIATATSQIFDRCALVTMTAAPYDMEDVPSSVAIRISGLTQGRFRHVALIDAHNSLTGPTTMDSATVGALEEATLASLQMSTEQKKGEFKVGVARNAPNGFSLKDGFGPGGISVLGIEANGQRFAYLSIDGNNMIKGLRNEILDSIRSVGFDDGEVMTTDTHMVNGIVHARLGYHLVGEVVPRKPLLDAITRTGREAINDLEACEVAAISGQIPVTTLGTKSLRRVMGLVYRVSKLTALTLFPMVVAITIISLLFLV
jgi:putative membrane protein